MTGRASALLWCAMVLMTVGCIQQVGGAPLRAAPGVDEDSLSPVDVDTVLLDREQMQAVTGSGRQLTAIPGTDSKVPVDIDFLAESLPPQCEWIYAETQVFGPEVEEFHKLTFQNPARGALISQAAAGYRDTPTARRAFESVVGRIDGCASTTAGGVLVGTVSTTADSVHTRPGDCGRDYRVKSAVLVEVTYCAFPESVPDIVMTNILANVPG
ncbi:sensor domain-containing protein [Mycobacterium sp. ITM-2016-00317]|uniref:sensor domain-containing protein n=1 Tax=Mycobacterium sp. ITM-2016-00317 TaxID=2099694 RepID=UPI000D4E7B4F|nr:sensor domain-containing protein [Mycobacterium sp. ITM-2016-00317]WNG89415.1 sensor domain-containing protein [Mycobacterium sp. ITM-2016-00317]